MSPRDWEKVEAEALKLAEIIQQRFENLELQCVEYERRIAHLEQFAYFHFHHRAPPPYVPPAPTPAWQPLPPVTCHAGHTAAEQAPQVSTRTSAAEQAPQVSTRTSVPKAYPFQPFQPPLKAGDLWGG